MGEATGKGQSGVNISGTVASVSGDIVGRDKIIYFGVDAEMMAKLDSLMALLSNRRGERCRLATRWIIEIAAVVFVDQMRILYVGASPIARRVNVHRYPEFINITKKHMEEFNNQVLRYSAELEDNQICNLRVIEQRHLFTLNRLEEGPCSQPDAERLFRDMKKTAEHIHEMCRDVQISGYGTTGEMIAEIGDQVWSFAGKPCGLEALDELFQVRLKIQSIFLDRTQDSTNTPILSIIDDVHHNYALAYFIVDRWLMQQGMPVA